MNTKKVTIKEYKEIQDTPMYFHIGKGGHFNKPGHKTFEGIYSFDEVLSRNNNTFEVHRDKRGLFCKPFLIDGSGNKISDNISGAYGVVEYDGIYDTDIVKPFYDCDDNEIAIVRNSDEWGFLPLHLQEVIEAIINDIC